MSGMPDVTRDSPGGILVAEPQGIQRRHPGSGHGNRHLVVPPGRMKPDFAAGLAHSVAGNISSRPVLEVSRIPLLALK